MEMEGKHSETTFLVVEVSSNGVKPLISLWNAIKYFFKKFFTFQSIVFTSQHTVIWSHAVSSLPFLIGVFFLTGISTNCLLSGFGGLLAWFQRGDCFSVQIWMIYVLWLL